MNLTQQPIRQKSPKAKPNPAYLAKVRQLPCIICCAFGEKQMSDTQAHHVIHQRGSFRKTPDEMAIPLCEGHHQGLMDTSKVAVHRQPSRWKRLYGPDTDWISRTQDMIEAAEAGNLLRWKP